MPRVGFEKRDYYQRILSPVEGILLDLTKRDKPYRLASSQGHDGHHVQALTDEKREEQNKVVKLLLPGIRRAMI